MSRFSSLFFPACRCLDGVTIRHGMVWEYRACGGAGAEPPEEEAPLQKCLPRSGFQLAAMIRSWREIGKEIASFRITHHG